MRWYYKLPLRLRSAFQKNRTELDLSEELQFHLQNQIDEYVAQGMNPKEARHAAFRSLGGIEQAKEECRDARKVNLIDNFLQDVRFGLRILRRSPGFSILAILCLTLGLGASAVGYSCSDGILSRPYPAVAHQERLVAIGGTSRDEPRGTPLSWPDFQDLQRSCRLCETLFVSKITGTTLSIGDRAERTTGSIVSANYFDAIGVPPMLGRGFLPGEDQGQSAHPVAVISYQLWRGRFRGDPQIIGKTERLDGAVHTIVGVAPEGFYGTFVGWRMNFWVPVSMEDTFEGGGYKLEDRGARWIESYARLKPGVTQQQAQQEFAAISQRLEATYPATNRGRGVRLWPLWQTPFNNAATLLPTLETMLVVVVCVLLIAARGGVQMYLPGELDWRVLALSATVCLVTTLLMGLVPALQTSKIDLASSMKMEAAGVVGGRGRAWVRSGLVLVQVSLSFILLVGTGLLMQSLLTIRSTSPGFNARGVQYTGIDLVSVGYTPARAQNFQDELLERVRSLPGVESAAFSRMVPLSYVSSATAPIVVDGYTPPLEESPTVDYNEVGPGYFVTLGIPLVSGREFTRADDEKVALVAMVNETMAQRYWQGRNPLGQRLQLKGHWLQVVGVAKDSKYSSVREKPTPFFFIALRQNNLRGGVLNIRTPLAPQTMAAALAREVRALDPDIAPYELITLQEQLERSTSPQMVAVTLVGVLGGVALLLAAVGLYGVMSYAVSQSTRELGLRMALGADACNLLRLVMSRGLALTAGGVLLGAAVALALTRLLGNLLYKVSPRDPLAFGSALAVMTIASLAACFLPAWRATRTDPARALRD